MPVIIFLFVIGAGMVGFGVWDQKNRFGSQQFTEGEIIGYQSVRHTAGSLRGMAINAVISAAVGLVSPVAKVTLESGEVRQIRLHTKLPKSTIDQSPDLQIGGKVSLVYFGSDPKEVYLVGHQLAEKPMRVSPVLLFGIPVLIMAVVLTIVYIMS